MFVGREKVTFLTRNLINLFLDKYKTTTIFHFQFLKTLKTINYTTQKLYLLKFTEMLLKQSQIINQRLESLLSETLIVALLTKICCYAFLTHFVCSCIIFQILNHIFICARTVKISIYRDQIKSSNETYLNVTAVCKTMKSLLVPIPSPFAQWAVGPGRLVRPL